MVQEEFSEFQPVAAIAAEAVLNITGKSIGLMKQAASATLLSDFPSERGVANPR